MRLLPSLLSREERFFGLLRSSANNLDEAAQLLVDLMEDYQDVPAKVAEIKRLRPAMSASRNGLAAAVSM